MLSKLSTVLCAVIIAGNVATAAHAQPRTRGLSVVPDEERRSHIVEVIGKADIPSHLMQQRGASDTEALRQKAISDGRSAAFSKVSDKISNSGDLELRGDAFSQDVVVLETKDISAPRDTYQVSMLVEVRIYPRLILAAPNPSQSTPGVQSSGVSQASQSAQTQPLTVSIRTDRRDYLEGEEIIVTMKGNRDFYARVTYEDAEGKTVQVLPNSFRSEVRFEANREYRIPGDGDRFRLRVTPPFGQERFTVYASSVPVANLSSAQADPASGISNIPAARGEVSHRARGLAVVEAPPLQSSETPPATSNSGRSVEFYEAVWAVNTRSREQQLPTPASTAPSAAPQNQSTASVPAKAMEAQPNQPSRPPTIQRPAKPNPPATNAADARLPQFCSLGLGRQLLADINNLKPIRFSALQVVDIQGLVTKSNDHTGLTCSGILVASNGERLPVDMRIFISGLGEVLFEVKPT